MQCFVIICVCFVILEQCVALREGDSCVAEGLPGSCKNLTDCLYADKLIVVDKKKPTHCSWYGNGLEVVCCPTGNGHWRGLFRSAFIGTKDGVLRSDDMVCRYDGSLPVTCCEQKRSNQVNAPQEPPQCPRLPQARGDLSHVAWNKCVEYQRYVKVCEQNANGKFVRRNACVMSSLANKISGGDPAWRKEFPHMALLGYRRDTDTSIKWLAGGSLISEKYILTAAHVLSHPDFELVRYALLGALAKSQAKEGLLYNVVRFEKHKFHTPKEKYYDIALLELDSPVIFSDFIRPACLYVPGMAISDDRVLAGWGRTGATQDTSDILLKTSVNEYPNSLCRARIDPQGLPRGWDDEAMICAGASANDSCQGDSGGPLMAYSDDLFCTYVVRGVVSWGPQCGQGSPGVYTKVDRYLDWIVNRVWPSST